MQNESLPTVTASHCPSHASHCRYPCPGSKGIGAIATLAVALLAAVLAVALVVSAWHLGLVPCSPGRHHDRHAWQGCPCCPCCECDCCAPPLDGFGDKGKRKQRQQQQPKNRLGMPTPEKKD